MKTPQSLTPSRKVNVLFSAPDTIWEELYPPIARALVKAGVPATIAPDIAPSDVDYIVFTPNGLIADFSPYINARAALSLWAGVDKVLGNTTLTMPLVRMVDPGQREGMVEYVTAQVLRHHLGLDRHLGSMVGWDQVAPKLARNRTVTILGLGELGGACASALAVLNFHVRGWSRRPRRLAGIDCYNGDEGLVQALSGAEIVVLLLPMTPQTENVLNSSTLPLLAPGAVVVNPGRGSLIDDAALIAALDDGTLGHATLDTFRVEPLPEDHAFRTHPKITASPHIASLVRAETCAAAIAENIRRGEAAEPLLNVVNREVGY